MHIHSKAGDPVIYFPRSTVGSVGSLSKFSDSPFVADTCCVKSKMAHFWLPQNQGPRRGDRHYYMLRRTHLLRTSCTFSRERAVPAPHSGTWNGVLLQRAQTASKFSKFSLQTKHDGEGFVVDVLVQNQCPFLCTLRRSLGGEVWKCVVILFSLLFTFSFTFVVEVVVYFYDSFERLRLKNRAALR